MEEFHVAYLAHYHWMDPEEGPDLLVACRFIAASKEDALRMAKAQLPRVIAGYTDEQDECTADVVEITVRAWAEWGNKLDQAWTSICNTPLDGEDEIEADETDDDERNV